MFGRVLARNSLQLIRGTGLLSAEITSPCPVLNKYTAQISTPSTSFFRSNHHGPKVQHPAPAFQGTAVINGDFKEIGLSDFKGKYLVLFFYPLDFTFVCPTEIIAFSDRIEEFKSINTAVVGVSCDSHFSHLAWINTPRKHGGLGDLHYPLLSDFNKSIARDYNVLLETDGVPLRGLFIIDPQGVIRQITVNDLPVGRSVDEILRLVKAFQFTDKHGEVECVKSNDGKEHKDSKKKFSVQNIRLTSRNVTSGQFQVSDETEETKNLSLSQLERAVLLDQLKFYRMQLKELESKKVEMKKQEKSTVNVLEERDCISV